MVTEARPYLPNSFWRRTPKSTRLNPERDAAGAGTEVVAGQDSFFLLVRFGKFYPPTPNSTL